MIPRRTEQPAWWHSTGRRLLGALTALFTTLAAVLLRGRLNGPSI